MCLQLLIDDIKKAEKKPQQQHTINNSIDLDKIIILMFFFSPVTFNLPAIVEKYEKDFLIVFFISCANNNSYFILKVTTVRSVEILTAN